MGIVTGIFIMLIYCAWHLWTAFGIAGDAYCRRRNNADIRKWAQEHEDEWLNGTNRVVKENGKLMYYEFNEYKGVPVKYGENGLEHNGTTVFSYLDIARSKHGRRVLHDREGRPVIFLGTKRCLCGIYKVIGEEIYYDGVTCDKRVYPSNSGGMIFFHK